MLSLALVVVVGVVELHVAWLKVLALALFGTGRFATHFPDHLVDGLLLDRFDHAIRPIGLSSAKVPGSLASAWACSAQVFQPMSFGRCPNKQHSALAMPILGAKSGLHE